MARKLLNEMKELGLTPTRFCWNSAISVHARTGNTIGRISRLATKRARGGRAALREEFAGRAGVDFGLDIERSSRGPCTQIFPLEVLRRP